MVRPNRIIFDGAIYHVIMRGINKEYILQSPRHKSFLIKQIKEYNKVLDFQLLGYVIMDNHYHLLIKTNKISISEIMFNINNVLGKYLSRELNRTGHIFEKRYTCKLVTSDAYLVWVLRYIHRNPIRAGICSNIDEYRWSSHYFYKSGFNSFVKVDFILSILSTRKAAAQLSYIELVHAAGDDSNPEIDQMHIKLKYNLGDEPFEEISNYKAFPMEDTRKSLESIFSSICLEEKSRELILAGSRKANLTPYKLEFVKEAIRNKYTLKEISLFLNVNSNSLSMLLSRYGVLICDL